MSGYKLTDIVLTWVHFILFEFFTFPFWHAPLGRRNCIRQLTNQTGFGWFKILSCWSFQFYSIYCVFSNINNIILYIWILISRISLPIIDWITILAVDDASERPCRDTANNHSPPQIDCKTNICWKYSQFDFHNTVWNLTRRVHIIRNGHGAGL